MPASRRYLHRQAKKLMKIHDINQLAKLLQVSVFHLIGVANKSTAYDIFRIHKKGGGKRLIEAPHKELKGIQRKLAFYFGALYHMIMPHCSFGYIFNTKQDKLKRNIVTNAQQHLNAAYMINADLEDFFHQIKSSQIHQFLSRPMFSFDERTKEILINLVTLDDRLPMGAPSSPSLSNLCLLDLDKHISQYCRWAGITYTRFVDNFTFSHPKDPLDAHFTHLSQYVQEANFAFNLSKTKVYGKKDDKIVTGIVIKEQQLTLDQSYFEGVKEAISYLSGAIKVSNYYQQKEIWIEEYKQKINGLLLFGEQVLGDQSEEMISLYNLYDEAVYPMDVGSQSWLDFSYL